MILEEELKRFPITKEIGVHWGDMDAARHVNNTVYLRWFESTRIEYMQALGANLTFDIGGGGIILAKQECKYIFPMTYPDTALIGVRVTEIAADRFVQTCSIFSKEHERIAAVATGLMVLYDYEKKQKSTMPNEMRDAILKMEEGNEINRLI